MHAQTLQMQLGVTEYVLKKNLEGMSHEDSLSQPLPGGNCANWVLGHIVRTRNNLVPMVGGTAVFPREMFDKYEADPITDASDALHLSELLAAYDKLSGPLLEGFGNLTAEQMAAPAPFSPTGNPDETLGSLLATTTFHEAYHAGQLGILRRLTGREGAFKSPSASAQTE